MKVIAINSSPRKGWNTEQMLQAALNGAADAGAEIELINIYDLSFTGCRSCLACKRKGADPCRCYWKDDLSPVLQKILEADVLLLGAPIYFGDVPAQLIALLERLSFILMTYDDYSLRLFNGRVDVGILLTMNSDKAWYEANVFPGIEKRFSCLNRLNGKMMFCAACDTLQFSQYDKYHAASFSESYKLAVRKEQFPIDLQSARDLGYLLVKER